MATVTKSQLKGSRYCTDLLITDNVFETAANLYSFRECTYVKEYTWVKFVPEGEVTERECKLLSSELNKLNSRIYKAWMHHTVYGELKLNPVLFFVDRYIKQFATKVTYRAVHIEYELSDDHFDQLYIYLDCIEDARFTCTRVDNKLYIH